MHDSLGGRHKATPDSGSEEHRPRFDSAHGVRTIPNSEARQREALEIADKFLNLHSDSSSRSEKQQGELSAGGGTVPVLILEDENELLHSAQSSPQAVSENSTDTRVASGEGQQAGATPVEGAAPNENGAPADGPLQSKGPSTSVITQFFTSGEARELVVDSARLDFLDIMSAGLESEDLESSGSGPEYLDWWTNVINAEGDLAPTVVRPSTGPTAALATSQQSISLEHSYQKLNAPSKNGEDDDQCKIAVLDVGGELGPSLGARPCDLSFRRVWPFARHKFGIDGVETLLPQHYQYAAEYWISQSIRNSSRFVADPSDADFVFIDMWCYHMAWLAYIHPLGNRNTSNPEPYMRRALNAIVKMDK